jgi:hypothetical protein
MKTASIRKAALAATALALIAGVAGVHAQFGPVTVVLNDEVQTLRGDLTADDMEAAEGKRVDYYEFQGQAGQVVGIGMTSTAVDARLVIFGPNDFEDENDNLDTGYKDAFLEVTLPATGPYLVMASTAQRNQTGAYEIVFMKQ